MIKQSNDLCQGQPAATATPERNPRRKVELVLVARRVPQMDRIAQLGYEVQVLERLKQGPRRNGSRIGPAERRERRIWNAEREGFRIAACVAVGSIRPPAC